MALATYRCRFEPEPDGSAIVVTFPDLPFGVTQGSDREEARRAAEDAIETVLSALIGEGAELPATARPELGEALISLSAKSSLQLELYQAMRDLGIDAAALATRLDRKPDHVAALIDLRNYPAVSDLERALLALGRRIVVSTVAAE